MFNSYQFQIGLLFFSLPVYIHIRDDNYYNDLLFYDLKRTLGFSR